MLQRYCEHHHAHLVHIDDLAETGFITRHVKFIAGTIIVNLGSRKYNRVTSFSKATNHTKLKAMSNSTYCDLDGFNVLCPSDLNLFHTETTWKLGNWYEQNCIYLVMT